MASRRPEHTVAACAFSRYSAPRARPVRRVAPVPFALFAAPRLSENAFRMVEAAAGLPEVRLGVVTQDEASALRHLAGRVAHWRVADVLDVDQLAWAAQGLARAHGPPDRLFGAFEQLQVPLAEARERLGIAGMSVEVAHNFRDKARMKARLRAAGLPCARHALVHDVAAAEAFAEAAGLPVVVKPPAGAGAVATTRVDTMDALRAAVRQASPSAAAPVLLEEFVLGEEHSFETVTVAGEHRWHSLTHYAPTPLEVLANPWIQWTLVLPREVDAPAYDDIRGVARRALDVLGMDTGLSHLEWFRRRDGSVAISEVAARPPGAQITQLMSYAHDVDVLREWARAMILGDFHAPARRYAAGAAFLRGQGRGRVVAVHGIDVVNREFGDLLVAAHTPAPGTAPSTSYEGEGWVIVRHPETAVVARAVRRLVEVLRVELG